MIDENTFTSLIKEYSAQIPKEYMEKHRFYHNESHINKMLSELLLLRTRLPASITELDIEWLLHAILWHDSHYNPLSQSNEELSVELFMKYNDQLPHEVKRKISRLIMVTKDPTIAETELERLMVYLDLLPLTKDVDSVLRDCENICKEYRVMDFRTFRARRIDFLTYTLPKWISICFEDKSSIVGPGMQQRMLEGARIALTHISNYRPKIGVYIGSFNPFHIGHKNILDQASKVFDKVILIQASNPTKNAPTTLIPETVSKLHQVRHLHDISILDIVRAVCDSPHAAYSLIRGIRSTYDLIDEQNYRQIVRAMGVVLQFTYFLSDYHHVSSSVVRQLEHLDQPTYKKYTEGV